MASLPGRPPQHPVLRINAHSFQYGTDTTFFAVANVGDGARVFVID
ncbi:MAG: hypothetical protein R3F43_14945 [bacterium]